VTTTARSKSNRKSLDKVRAHRERLRKQGRPQRRFGAMRGHAKVTKAFFELLPPEESGTPG